MSAYSLSDLNQLTVADLKAIVVDRGLLPSNRDLYTQLILHGRYDPKQKGETSRIVKPKSPKVVKPSTKALAFVSVNFNPAVKQSSAVLDNPKIDVPHSFNSRFNLPTRSTNATIAAGLHGDPEPSTIYLSDLQMLVAKGELNVDEDVEVIGTPKKIRHDTEAVRFIARTLLRQRAGEDLDLEAEEEKYDEKFGDFQEDGVDHAITPEEIAELKRPLAFKKAYIAYPDEEDERNPRKQVYYEVDGGSQNLSWYTLLKVVKEIEAKKHHRSHTYFWGFRRVGRVGDAPILVPSIERS